MAGIEAIVKIMLAAAGGRAHRAPARRAREGSENA